MNRTIIRVKWCKVNETWAVSGGGGIITAYRDTKAEAVRTACLFGRTIYHDGGKAQVVIHNKNGRIQEERTYGDDPRSPG